MRNRKQYYWVFLVEDVSIKFSSFPFKDTQIYSRTTSTDVRQLNELFITAMMNTTLGFYYIVPFFL